MGSEFEAVDSSETGVRKGIETDWLATAADDAGAVVDLAERYAEAEAAVGTQLGGVLSEGVQRRLYALHMVARRGAAPEAHDPAELQREQWQAWREASGLTQEAAMSYTPRLSGADL